MTVQNYLSYFDDLIAPTETLFRKVPQDRLDWKPTEKSFTAAQLMTHMADSLALYSRGLAGNWGVSSMKEIFLANRRTEQLTVEEAVERFRKNYAAFRSQIGKLSEEEFNQQEIDTPQLGRVPRWRAAMLALEHHVSHKAELFMYLKFIGAGVHTGHLYGDRREHKA